MSAPAPILVLGIGNPSRGDDALGPRFVEALAEALAAEVAAGALELATDFQLQPEHTLELVGRRQVVVVDASVDAPPPFAYAAVSATSQTGAMSHALAPSGLLDLYRQGIGEPPPPAAVLAIRGERFDLGAPLSARAAGHLAAAVRFFVDAVAPGADVTARRRRRLEVDGVVGGVGLRPWVARVARDLGLVGTVGHTRRGLAIDATGSVAALDALLVAVSTRGPAAGAVDAIRVTDLAPAAEREDGFAIVASDRTGGGPATHGLAPDLACCDACVAELARADGGPRGYAFVSCARCGPRLAIATALPFDRATTTMAGFTACPACAAACAEPDDRRFHDPLAACPACGPRLRLVGPDGAPRDDGGDPIATAATLLAAGGLVAVHGAGGFQLVGDATRAAASVADAEPMTLLLGALAQAEALVELDDAARTALTSSARPIVLAPARPGVAVAAATEPPRRLGVLLPQSALEHLLVAAVGRPLVVSSGHPDGGPAVLSLDDAVAAYGSRAAAFLVSDLPSARAVEPSLIGRTPAAPGGLRVVRRSRGFAPRPLRLPAPVPQAILAVGSPRRACACVVVDDLAYLTPHLGEIATATAAAAWQRAVEELEALLGVVAPIVAHDLDGAELTTCYALARAAARHVAVPRAVAQVLAAVAELHLGEPVIGVVVEDAAAEVVLVDGPRWHPVATVAAPPTVAAADLASALAAAVTALVADRGLRHVVLSGERLEEPALEAGLRARLAGRAVMAREVPVSSAGRALGQAWFAALAADAPP